MIYTTTGGFICKSFDILHLMYMYAVLCSVYIFSAKDMGWLTQG